MLFYSSVFLGRCTTTEIKNNLGPSGKQFKQTMISVIFTAVQMLLQVLWVVTPCEIVGRYKRFRETYCLHIQNWQYIPLKHSYLPANPHGMECVAANTPRI
jgi:hypothetical protein